MIGMGERTSPMGAEILSQQLFASGQAQAVIAVELPKSHSMMHLDTAMTMVDRATFVLYPYFDRHSVRGRSLPRDGWLQRQAEPQPVGSLAAVLGVEEVTVLVTDEDIRAAEREQWDDGTNYLAVALASSLAMTATWPQHDAEEARHRGRERRGK